MVRRRTISQEDVMASLAAARPLTSGSGPWTRRFLEIAGRQFSGAWHEVEFSGSEALDIILPPHAGEPCRGDRLPLVPPGGASTAEAVDALRRIRGDYEIQNPSCWGRIAEAAAAPFSPVILTAEPLDADDYHSIVARPGRLYHLDGFHRLVGWGWAGRLTPGVRLTAFLAEQPSPTGDATVSSPPVRPLSG
jgi:hypothetical protein